MCDSSHLFIPPISMCGVLTLYELFTNPLPTFLTYHVVLLFAPRGGSSRDSFSPLADVISLKKLRAIALWWFFLHSSSSPPSRDSSLVQMLSLPFLRFTESGCAESD